MSNGRRRRRRHGGAVEWGKNALVLLLALSALYLTGRSGLYSEAVGSPGGWIGGLMDFFRQSGDPAPQGGTADARPPMAAQPVRAAVHNGEERFAAQYDSAQCDRLFDALGGLLGEGLASAKAPAQISQPEWQAALGRPGVYFDFLGTIPLNALYAWLGEGIPNPSLTGEARHVLLALTREGSVALYYSNESTGLYYACETSVAYQGHMEDLLANYGGNSATFAFESGAGSGYEGLDPYVLIFSSPPSPRVYHSSNPLEGGSPEQTAALQQALAFRPQSSSVYPVQGGTRVREGKETLEIGDNGVVVYHAAEQGASRYPVPPEDGGDAGIIDAARKLAVATVGAWCGEARLYLLDLTRQEDGTATIRFGYSLDGAAVYLQGDPCAASFTIQDGFITGFTLRLRTYEDTGEYSLVLRELLAAAAMDALPAQGRELALIYEDNGGPTAQAGWTAR